jgi:hypothetical protein
MITLLMVTRMSDEYEHDGIANCVYSYYYVSKEAPGIFVRSNSCVHTPREFILRNTKLSQNYYYASTYREISDVFSFRFFTEWFEGLMTQ